MDTKWTNAVDRNDPLHDYPRPQMVREGWMSLNGIWEYAITDDKVIPEQFDGPICVPFSPESALSLVGKAPGAGQYLWYRRTVSLSGDLTEKRVILHFGAVDQKADVWVNEKQVVSHTGGYLPFEADITSALTGEEAVIVVRVTDDTDASWHTRGNQSKKTEGRGHTAQSGIWQTVWLETVPQSYVRALRITPYFDDAEVDIAADLVGSEPAFVHFNGRSYELPALIPVPDFEAWSPENPKLYGFTVTCGEDRVESYFAMRKFSVGPGENGVPRLLLNNKPYFQNGVLDGGFWPDGLYTAPTDEAMRSDILTAKACGFNMIRKHRKVEPLRWYHHCDTLGMLVWQDMPCGGGPWPASVVSVPLYTRRHLSDSDYARFGRGEELGRREFQDELVEMVIALYNCPCIAMWVLFDEGRGQFDAAAMTDAVRFVDNTRTVDHASGWHDQGAGDVRSEHVSSRPYRFRADEKGRAVVLSSFGSRVCRIREHSVPGRVVGGRRYASAERLREEIKELYAGQILPAAGQGLSAAVYAQLCDVENEENGLVTFDRQIMKIAPDEMKAIVLQEK